jgi:hypothetical protein
MRAPIPLYGTRTRRRKRFGPGDRQTRPASAPTRRAGEWWVGEEGAVGRCGKCGRGGVDGGLRGSALWLWLQTGKRKGRVAQYGEYGGTWGGRIMSRKIGLDVFALRIVGVGGFCCSLSNEKSLDVREGRCEQGGDRGARGEAQCQSLASLELRRHAFS